MDQNILKSKYTQSFNSDSNIPVYELLLEKAEQNVKAGKLNWMTNAITNETIRFDQLEELSRKVALSMQKRGMVKGDTVLYLTTDVTKIYVIMLGIWRCGGIVYSSYPEDTQDTLKSRIIDSKAKWIISDPVSIPQCKDSIKGLDWDVEIFVFGDQVFQDVTPVASLFEHSLEALEKVTVSDTDPILILCTSGTTGKSKGAIYTNKSVRSFILATDGFPWKARPFLYLSRCTHVLGVLFPFRNVEAGSWSVLMHQVTKVGIYQAIQTYKPFLVFGFPTYLLGIVEDVEAMEFDRSSVEVICTGGLVITPSIYERLYKLPSLKAVMNGFGMTECGAITTTVDLNCKDDYRVVPNMPPFSVGLLYPNTELKVLDLKSGESLGSGKRGELAIRSPVMCNGYLNHPEQSFEDGWLRTGDMGYYDENGFVFVCGRIKDTFKYFNNHISPDELEETLLAHPAVAEAVVFGIKDEGGDIPRALVVLKENLEGSGHNASEIQKFAEDKLASYKAFRGGLFIVPKMPKGKTGKISRTEISKLPLSLLVPA